MNKLLTKCAIAAVALIGWQQTIATPSAEALSYTCAGCHGFNGASNGPAIPSLAGLGEEYLIEAMQEYKEDKRNPTIMNRIAKGYNDEEFKLMAQFFAKQEVHIMPDQSQNSKLAKAGKKLHKKYCKKCHEDGGTNPEDEAGQLLGNTRLFIQYSLQDFKDGSRKMPKKMKKQFSKMVKKDKNATSKILEYYSKGDK